jgi:thiol:disulfide interchange protein DsbD
MLCMAAGNAFAAETTKPWLLFKPIKTVDDLKRELAAASVVHRPVVVVVRAEWAVSGIELERKTLTDTDVQAALNGIVQMRIDVTANDDEDKKMFPYLDIFGPPVVLFYGADGKEKRNLRVVGFMKAAQFAAVVRQAVAPATQPTQ